MLYIVLIITTKCINTTFVSLCVRHYSLSLPAFILWALGVWNSNSGLWKATLLWSGRSEQSVMFTASSVTTPARVMCYALLSEPSLNTHQGPDSQLGGTLLLSVNSARSPLLGAICDAHHRLRRAAWFFIHSKRVCPECICTFVITLCELVFDIDGRMDSEP